MVAYPNGQVDQSFLSSWGSMAGVDEVGRGALAGPLAVGVVAVDSGCPAPPIGVADSKALTFSKRAALVAPIRHWAAACAVGWATPTEIADLGLTGALRLAALRAFALVDASLRRAGRPLPNGVLLDGKHDYLSHFEPSLFAPALVADPWEKSPTALPVATMIQADMHSHAVAAASILAKVARDRYMAEVRDPGYGWATNRGYGSKKHVGALRMIGPSHRHRLSWSLPGMEDRRGGELN